MLHALWVLIVGAVFGIIAGAIAGHGKAMNWIVNIIAGLMGSVIGEVLLGNLGPKIAEMAIFPSIIGAVMLVLLVSWLMSMFNKGDKPGRDPA